MLAGRYRMGGELIDAPGRVLWDALPESADALREGHGFSWLDDLMAVPLPQAEQLAQVWTAEWIDTYGSGRGPGWVPDLSGRRALRLVLHGEALEPVDLGPALARHINFLESRAYAAPTGWPRVEALTGLIHAQIALDPRGRGIGPALTRLGAASDALINGSGAVGSRNPAALAQAVLLLGSTAEVLNENGHEAGVALPAIIARGAKSLRALTQSDGRLPRFHGGDGSPGLADRALGMARHRLSATPSASAMGFARLRHGRSSLVLDSAAPPTVASASGHASTLALELTVGRRPMIVNCGPGDRFGSRRARTARATASHSTLSLEGFSSSRIGRGQHRLLEVPSTVLLEREETGTGTRFTAAHDGYAGTHGLWHERTLELARDGRRLVGEDVLVAKALPERRRYERVRRRAGPPRFAVRFHLDPDVEPSLDMGGHAVSLLLASGVLWVFRPTAGIARLSLEPTLIFRETALQPIESQQIVLFSSAGEYANSHRVGTRSGADPRHPRARY